MEFTDVVEIALLLILLGFAWTVNRKLNPSETDVDDVSDILDYIAQRALDNPWDNELQSIAAKADRLRGVPPRFHDEDEDW